MNQHYMISKLDRKLEPQITQDDRFNILTINNHTFSAFVMTWFLQWDSIYLHLTKSFVFLIQFFFQEEVRLTTVCNYTAKNQNLI